MCKISCSYFMRMFISLVIVCCNKDTTCSWEGCEMHDGVGEWPGRLPVVLVVISCGEEEEGVGFPMYDSPKCSDE